MSLRVRLLSGVLAMTAIGLIAAGGGTYLALRSFLLDRVDQQLCSIHRRRRRAPCHRASGGCSSTCRR
jgi:hypothetical protein